jgi:hypothetical protein
LLEALEVRAPQFIANTLSILPVASYGPAASSRPSRMLAASHHQRMRA